jgi:hypothetical protein
MMMNGSATLKGQNPLKVANSGLKVIGGLNTAAGG